MLMKALLILFVELHILREGPRPVTNQVTTHADGFGRSRVQSDWAPWLTCESPTHFDAFKRFRQEWHARGPGFESP